MRHASASSSHDGDATRASDLELTWVYNDATHAQLRAAGELQRSTVDMLTAVLETLLGWGRRHVRLDLAEVTVSDAESLEALVRVHEMYLAEHGLLVLSPVNPDLTDLLHRNRLERALFISDHSEAQWDGGDRRGGPGVPVGSEQ